jgi:hypothetical protein
MRTRFSCAAAEVKFGGTGDHRQDRTPALTQHHQRLEHLRAGRADRLRHFDAPMQRRIVFKRGIRNFARVQHTHRIRFHSPPIDDQQWAVES